LAEAHWYQSPVEAVTMRSLLVRRNWPGIRDTVIWFSLLVGTALAGIALWGSWWAVLPFAVYGVLYASTSDSRWHEASHGTAFKTGWLNDALYEIASFMVMRESTLWRWSHIRHHSDTIIVGRDPEISFPRPGSLMHLVLVFTGVGAIRSYIGKLVLHAGGSLDAEEQTFVPRDQWNRVVWTARIHVAIYGLVITTAVLTGSLLPLVLVGLPNLYGSWLMPVYGATQHAGLAENVLDHRLNCRTVLMNPLNRFLYWNMNYHIEHHMFPMVPYHQLPRLHAAVVADMPTPYRSLWSAWREIIPALRRQRVDPTYCVHREVPTPTATGTTIARSLTLSTTITAEGWWDLGPADSVARESVARADQGERTLAVYRHGDGTFHATDGLCTHGRVHLAEGLVHGNVIECPKHNGRFDLRDGTVRRAPACAAIASYPTRVVEGRLQVDPRRGTTKDRVRRFRVVSNQHLTAFIREVLLEPVADGAVPFTPGDYLRFVIPPYQRRALADLAIPADFAAAWERAGVRDLVVTNPSETRRNYSLANSAAEGRRFRFTVRLALPPAGSPHSAGVGSAYLWSLRPGDEIDAAGPFGDFHLRPGTGEVIAIGGGAGMAPLRAHIAHLLEVEQSTRRIRLWYGARTRRDLFYEDYFADLARRFPTFTYRMALSEPAEDDAWDGPTGFIHQVVERDLFVGHDRPRDLDFYLCGPPAMMQASVAMLQAQGVERGSISCDEF
jgi:MocE subfamily Rieske [2Fe-2S] domain protein